MRQVIYCFKCNKYVDVTKVFYEDVQKDDPLISKGRSRIGDLEVKCGHSRRERTGDPEIFLEPEMMRWNKDSPVPNKECAHGDSK